MDQRRDPMRRLWIAVLLAGCIAFQSAAEAQQWIGKVRTTDGENRYLMVDTDGNLSVNPSESSVDLATSDKQDEQTALLTTIEGEVCLDVTLVAVEADTTAIAGSVASIDEKIPDQMSGRIPVLAQPYGSAIAEGMVPGHTPIHVSAARENVQVVATGSDIWQGTATARPYPADSGEQLIAVSTSVEDDPDKGGEVAGTGCHQIKVFYLDPDGDTQTVLVDLDGTTPVTLSVALIRFVQTGHSTVVGTTGACVGKVTIYQSGDPTRVYGQIEAGRNVDASTMRMVPAGHTLYVTGVYATATEKSVAVAISATTDGYPQVLLKDIFLVQGMWFLLDSGIYITLEMPVKVPAFGIVKMVVYVPAAKNGADVSGGWGGWIEVDE